MGTNDLLVRNLDCFGRWQQFLLKENFNMTVGDLDQSTDAVLFRIPGLGKRAVSEIRQAISKLKGPVDYRPQWEYRTLSLTGVWHEVITRLGVEGWEAVTSVGDNILLLKREIHEPRREA